MLETEFYRVKRLPPYVFAEVNAMKARARAAGDDIIDLGMGNPDQPTPQHIVDKLAEAAANPRAHRYSASRGIPGLRRALAAYYERRFNVTVDPDTETIVTLGSKEGLANLAQAITSPGDIVLAPNPSYPIHAFGFIIAGGSVRHIPCEPNQAFLDALERGVRHSVPKPIAVLLNYPSNPTALLANLDFYGQVVDFCRYHGIWILSDMAYSEIYFGDEPPPSILQVPGAREVAVEFTSLSKSYNMPGWRIGFAAGNRHLIGALTRIKSYLDYGAFTPVQVAATAALNGPQDCVAEIRSLYKDRRDAMVEAFDQTGWSIPSPPATMFAWAPLPPAFAHLGSLEFSKLLLQEAKVAVSPGIGFGEHGDQHVRIALVENRQRIRQAARNIKTFLSNYDKVLEDSERKRTEV
ncbi:LL-diaminopimelate aminotransferase [Roseospira marina]|uniref:Aminotransferase n=1 Tax=Roseospira marina TaxID=140057 RepID=A0A5M6IG05_9PROT|nr:LL-diaminopimelate aminotransferase [Roseospira marina]KAA5607241.1 LL-diaminopimelate aminotransferase [Roseospira marina]MBB4312607.1 alanine-synthesizing transaminase [Roseospira marina]MBB5085377.1 alanine-synthesizing transaminase [Roseospira marina]